MYFQGYTDQWQQFWLILRQKCVTPDVGTTEVGRKAMKFQNSFLGSGGGWVIPMEGKARLLKGHTMTNLNDYNAEDFARLEQRSAMGTAAWRLLMPPVSIKRKVTVLVIDQFTGPSLPTLIQPSVDNNTSVIAIEARDFSSDAAEGRVIALVRTSKQSIIKFKGSLWSRERGQACIVFDAQGDATHMRISHQGKLRLVEGLPQDDFEQGVQRAAKRLLTLMAANDDTPGCQLAYRMPAL